MMQTRLSKITCCQVMLQDILVIRVNHKLLLLLLVL
jgi:hypothetical protein